MVVEVVIVVVVVMVVVCYPDDGVVSWSLPLTLRRGSGDLAHSARMHYCIYFR